MDRWKDADTKKLYEHFERGDIDPKKQEPVDIKDFFDKTPWLQDRTTLKKFYRNYRRHANIWIAEQGKHNARSKYSCIHYLMLPS